MRHPPRALALVPAQDVAFAAVPRARALDVVADRLRLDHGRGSRGRLRVSPGENLRVLLQRGRAP